MGRDEEISRRILVVDDDEVMRELLSALLEVQGYEVQTATSGEHALALLEAPYPPELILTDLQMPGLEGEALTSALREAAPAGSLLLGMSGAKPSASTLGFLDSFLSKPFSAAQLEETIASVRSERKLKEETPANLPSPVNATGMAEGIAAPDTPAMAADNPVLDEAIFSSLSRSFRAEQLRELYHLTLDDVTQRHGRMLDHAAAADLGAVQREAHAIKGSCGFVGARQLQHLAAAAEGGTTVNTSALADFPAACERLRRMLNAKLQQ